MSKKQLTQSEREKFEAEIARLKRWQDEAMVCLMQWDTCYDLLEERGHAGTLGAMRSAHVYRYLERTVPVKSDKPAAAGL